MNRRTFLLRGSGTFAVVSSPVLTPLTAAAFTAVQPAPDDKSGMTRPLWSTIAAVQNHLFPSEAGAPGALQVNAANYLHNYLTNPMTDPADTRFIRQGVINLEQLSKSATGTQFIELSNEQREDVLRLYEKQAEGRRWLTTVLNYLLEALLTDPVYGGNPQGIGWQWLEHRAGLPRPPVSKRYWLL